MSGELRETCIAIPSENLYNEAERDNENIQGRRRASVTSNISKMAPQQPVVDLIVALLAIPSLIIFALLLETNMTDEWADEPRSRWTVLGLGVGLLFISLLVCGYVTHRMGVCLWAGPQDDSDMHNNSLTRNNSGSNLDNYFDFLPPSYDTIMGFDVPPPPYHCVVKLEPEIKCPIPIDQDTSNHM